jgi:hypothetical protein
MKEFVAEIIICSMAPYPFFEKIKYKEYNK